MDSLKWLFGVFTPKGKPSFREKEEEEREKEMLREYEVLTSMKERAQQVIQLAKESPDYKTSSELLDNISLNFPPSLIQEPISSRTLDSAGAWRLTVDSAGRFLYSTNNDGLGKVTVYDLQSPDHKLVRSFPCKDIYKARGIALSERDDTPVEEGTVREVTESFIYITGDHMVHKYTLEGEFVTSFGSCYPGSDDAHCSDPNGLRVHNNRVYVCDSKNERIMILSLDLEYQRSITNRRRKERKSFKEEVDYPCSEVSSVLSDPPPPLVLSEELSSDGEKSEDKELEAGEKKADQKDMADQKDAGLLPAVEMPPVAPPQPQEYYECSCQDGMCPLHPYLNHPEDIVFDSKGNMHVLDSGKAAITVFSKSRRFQRFIQLPTEELPFPVSLCLFDDYYYIADYKLGQVVVVSMLGTIQHKFAIQSQELETGGFVLLNSRKRQLPLGVGVDNSGLIYVSNTCSDQIWVY